MKNTKTRHNHRQKKKKKSPPSSIAIEGKTNPSNQTPQNKNNYIQKVIKNFLYRQRATDWIMTIFTFLLFWNGCVTNRIYEEQKMIFSNQLATQKSETRAWISVSSLGISTENQGKYLFTLSYENIGKSPAKQIHVCINHVEWIQNIPTNDIDIQKGKNGEYVVPNGNRLYVDWTLKPMKRWNFGTIWYTDVYNVDHWIQFCFQRSPLDGRTLLFQSDIHNQADQNED